MIQSLSLADRKFSSSVNWVMRWLSARGLRGHLLARLRCESQTSA
jgi:hypothetical protein